MNIDQSVTKTDVAQFVLGFATILALIGPPLHWIWSVFHAWEGYEMYAQRQMGELYRFTWPVAVALTWSATWVVRYVADWPWGFIRPMLIICIFAPTIFVFVPFYLPMFALFIIWGVDACIRRLSGAGFNAPRQRLYRFPLWLGLLVAQMLATFMSYLKLEWYWYFP